MPESQRKDEIPATVYSLSNTIRNKIFNYKNTGEKINTNDTRTYGTVLILRYLNRHHGHIINGDLRIIENKKLRKIVSTGLNYRQPNTINWKKSKESIVEGLDNLNNRKLLSDKKIFKESLIPWTSVILTKVEKKINK